MDSCSDPLQVSILLIHRIKHTAIKSINGKSNWINRFVPSAIQTSQSSSIQMQKARLGFTYKNNRQHLRDHPVDESAKKHLLFSAGFISIGVSRLFFRLYLHIKEEKR